MSHLGLQSKSYRYLAVNKALCGQAMGMGARIITGSPGLPAAGSSCANDGEMNR